MRIKGERGALLAGFKIAAKLARWDGNFDKGADDFEVRARASEVDDFWIAHRPLYLELFIGNRGVKWPVRSVGKSRGKLTITAITREGSWASGSSSRKQSA